MKFIHISDVHLGAWPDADRDWARDRKREIEETFSDIIDKCEEEKLDLLLIAGNLFHTCPTVEELKEVDRKLSKLTHTKTVIIAGDCDYIAPGSDYANYKFESKAVVLPAGKVTNAYLKELNCCVTGYSYEKPEYTERVLEEIKPGKKDAFNILLGHGGDRTHMPFNKEVLAKKGFDYIALGHSMKPAHILKNKMAFSGSPEAIVYTETGERGYILGTSDENGFQIKWLPISKRNYYNLNLDIDKVESNFEACKVIEDEILKLGVENIYRIIIQGVSDDTAKFSLDRIKTRYNVFDIVDKTIGVKYVQKTSLENSNNITGHFIETMQEYTSSNQSQKEKAMRYGLMALAKAGEKYVSE